MHSPSMLLNAISKHNHISAQYTLNLAVKNIRYLYEYTHM